MAATTKAAAMARPRVRTGMAWWPHMCRRRGLSTTAPAGSASSGSKYDNTLANLRIGRHTRVMFQGFTGRQATANARESLAWGTQVVGGVSPGRSAGELHLGLPVFPSVRAAMEAIRPDATGVYVAAHQAAAAIEEAVEAEVPLIVAVAEHVPVHDMLRIQSLLKTQSRSRLVGANSPGIISSIGHCRVGFQPLPCFMPGRVGIAAKSGTLSYEAVASTTRAGLGQSLCIGVGGDALPGTDLREAVSVLVDDPDTDAVVLIGEIGGTGELDAADWIRNYHQRTPSPKPIVACIGGTNAAPGKVMGHAGAFTAPGEPDAATKIKALEAVGVTIVSHPAKFGDAIKERLKGMPAAFATAGASMGGSIGQTRGLHTTARSIDNSSGLLPPPHGRIGCSPKQARGFSTVVESQAARNTLRRQGINVNAGAISGDSQATGYLAVAIDRASRQPCILACPPSSGSTVGGLIWGDIKKFPFDYRTGPSGLRAGRIVEHMRLGTRAQDSLRKLIGALAEVFCAKQAMTVETRVIESLGELTVVDAMFRLDPAGRKAQRDHDGDDVVVDDGVRDPVEAEAKEHGIVYITLPGASGTVGTLVNGAGLAMNTVDALAELSRGSVTAANFLDTGGKATSETVKKSFELILRDDRVLVIFVNIFGGLTLGDMIARGILLAYQDLGASRLADMPVVVRIRGTNEAEGQRIIAESGLPGLYAFDDFDEAAAKAIELSQQ